MNRITKTSITFGAILAFPLLAAAQWTAAPASPPSNNVAAPINISGNAQTKTGNLTVSGFQSDSLYVQGGGSAYVTGNLGVGVSPGTYKINANGSINATEYCISGANCITAWPSGGGGATPTFDQVLAAGNTTARSFTAGGATFSGNVNAPAYFYSSDERLKTNIQSIPNALEQIMKLRGVTYTLKINGSPSVGVIAQEVEKVFPALVATGQDGYKSVQYANLVAPLIEAVKAQQKQIEALQAEVAALKNK